MIKNRVHAILASAGIRIDATDILYFCDLIKFIGTSDIVIP